MLECSTIRLPFVSVACSELWHRNGGVPVGHSHVVVGLALLDQVGRLVVLKQGLGGYILALEDILAVVLESDEIVAIHVVVLVHVGVEAAGVADTKDFTAFRLEAHLNTSAHGSLDLKTVRLPKKNGVVQIFKI